MEPEASDSASHAAIRETVIELPSVATAVVNAPGVSSLFALSDVYGTLQTSPENAIVPDVAQNEERQRDLADAAHFASTHSLLRAPSQSVASTADMPAYIQFVAKLQQHWKDCPDVHIQFQDLSYVANIPVKDTGIRNFIQAGWDGLKNASILKKIHPSWGPKTKRFTVLAPMSGRIAPGTMTLLLTPPGHGKSTFLKALAGRLQHDPNLSGSVLYNGISSKDARVSHGVNTNRMLAYIGQNDIHFPMLRVQETLDFAAHSALPDLSLLTSDPELLALEQKRSEMMMGLLGLEECASTVLGSDLVRGVSGGQRRRVTLGEMLMTNARCLLMDEVSTGLDAAITFHIFHALQQWTRVCNGSVVTALLQPTPEVYGLFDEIMLMRDGELVYHGPRVGVRAFFADDLGVPIPEDADEGGFVVDYLNDPNSVIKRLHKLERKTEAKLKKQLKQQRINLDSPNNHSDVEASHSSSDSELTVVENSLSKRKSVNIDAPCTTEAILDTYQNTDHFTHSQAQLLESLQKCRSDPKLRLSPENWSEYTRSAYAATYPHSFLRYTKMDMVRQAKLTVRNLVVFVPRVIQACLTGVIFGTLFFQLSPDDYASKFGLLMYCVMAMAFSNVGEIPVSSEAKNVVTKQLDAGFYPALSFVFSNMVWSVPRIFIEITIFGTLMYWIPGFTSEGSRYLWFLLILLLSSLSMSTFLRTISFVTPNPDVARQLDIPFILVTVIFGGFLIPYNKIPDWLIWVYWLNPLQWGVTSLSLNEFKSARYDRLSSGGQRVGDLYLQAYSIRTDEIYQYTAVAYLLSFFAIFGLISALGISYVRSTAALGTKRLPAELPSKAGAKKTKAESTKSLPGVTVINIPPPNSLEAPGQLPTLNETSFQSSFKGPAASRLPFVPVTLAWRNIRYTVTLPSGKQKVLLQNISGFSKPGTMTALMGSSGAGKTTLMDVIAGRKTVGVIEGDILVNGRHIDRSLFNRLAGYVEQQDLHMGTTTVREALQFSAKLRLPASVERSTREAWIEEVMSLVGLTKIAGRMVGDVALPSLSPGQLKLLTIGVELVANPSVLFLDEPTSGLDAPSAYRVMSAVKRITQTGRSVLCTIHQPSSELFFMFDRLLLLRSGGEGVYFADIGEHGRQLVQYFETASAGKAPKCPEEQNPANWMLDVIGAGVASAEGGGIQTSGFQYADYAALWKQSALYGDAERDLKQATDSSSVLDELLERVSKQVYVSGWTRYTELQKRYFVMHWRNPPANLTRCLLMLCLGLLLGIIYYKIGRADFQSVQSQIAAMFLGFAFAGAVAPAAPFPSFFRQRAVYYRESTIGMYNYLTYSAAVAILEMPYTFFSLAFFMFPFYFMIGLELSATLFMKYYLITWLMAYTYASLSQLWMALIPTQIGSNVMSAFTMTMFYMFGGVFVQPNAIPSGWKWFYYIDPIPKALIASTLPQFYCDTSSGAASGCPKMLVTSGGGVKSVFIYDYIAETVAGSITEEGKYIGFMILTIVVIRLLSMVVLKKVSHLKR